jgi:hypothetical protein
VLLSRAIELIATLPHLLRKLMSTLEPGPLLYFLRFVHLLVWIVMLPLGVVIGLWECVRCFLATILRELKLVRTEVSPTDRLKRVMLLVVNTNPWRSVRVAFVGGEELKEHVKEGEEICGSIAASFYQ